MIWPGTLLPDRGLSITRSRIWAAQTRFVPRPSAERVLLELAPAAMVSASQPGGGDGDARTPILKDLEGCLFRLPHRLFPPLFLIRSFAASPAARFGAVKGALFASLPAHAVTSVADHPRSSHSITDKRLTE
jgi:hypothetical protein